MRLILSRKGFDSSSGGCPNPVFPDGSALALPIPDSQSPIRYGKIRHQGKGIGPLVTGLTSGKVKANHRAHLDPDVIPEAYPREDGWRPILGQHGQAQSHLMKRGVGAGDLFLFFALFREVERHRRQWRFVPGARPFHALWGWLQVAEVVSLGDGHRVPAWAEYHPHLSGQRGVHNTLYLSAESLELPGLESSVPGAGLLGRMKAGHRLTAPDARGVTDWLLPEAFFPSEGREPLSYHHNRDRWQRAGEGRCRLKSAARGQEFVLDLEHYPGVASWLAGLFASGE